MDYFLFLVLKYIFICKVCNFICNFACNLEIKQENNPEKTKRLDIMFDALKRCT